MIIMMIIIIINKVLIKVKLNNCRGTLQSWWLKRCKSTGLTVNSQMTIETEMSLNANGYTAVTAYL